MCGSVCNSDGGGICSDGGVCVCSDNGGMCGDGGVYVVMVMMVVVVVVCACRNHANITFTVGSIDISFLSMFPWVWPVACSSQQGLLSASSMSPDTTIQEDMRSPISTHW